MATCLWLHKHRKQTLIWRRCTRFCCHVRRASGSTSCWACFWLQHQYKKIRFNMASVVWTYLYIHCLIQKSGPVASQAGKQTPFVPCSITRLYNNGHRPAMCRSVITEKKLSSGLVQHGKNQLAESRTHLAYLTSTDPRKAQWTLGNSYEPTQDVVTNLSEGDQLVPSRLLYCIEQGEQPRVISKKEMSIHDRCLLLFRDFCLLRLCKRAHITESFLCHKTRLSLDLGQVLNSS